MNMRVNLSELFGGVEMESNQLRRLVEANPEMRLNGDEAEFFSEGRDIRFSICQDKDDEGNTVFKGYAESFNPKTTLCETEANSSITDTLAELAEAWNDLDVDEDSESEDEDEASDEAEDDEDSDPK